MTRVATVKRPGEQARMNSAAAATSPRLAVLPLFWGRTDVLKGCLEPLLAQAPGRFDLYAIENPSEHSGENRALLRAALEQGAIKGLYLPERNAVFNSLLVALSQDVFGLAGRYDHVVLSDGDVAVEPDAFAEQAALLDAHPQMSSCAVRIDIRQWSPRSKSFPAAVKYAEAMITAEASGQPYAVSGGGFWMRMFRTEQILRLARTFDRNGQRLRDSNIDRYFKTAGMFPACALRSYGVELPNGPLLDAVLADKRKAHRTWSEAGYADPFDIDIAPGGEVLHAEPAAAGPSPAAEALALATPAPPAAFGPVGGWPEAAQARPTRAVVCERLHLEDPPAPVMLLHAPWLRQVLVADDGAWAMVPMVSLLEADWREPFLDEIIFDARDGARRPKSFLPDLMQTAARTLRPGGTVAVVSHDWAAAAESYLSWSGKLTSALEQRDDKAALFAAGRAMKSGRPFQDQPILFEPGQVLLAAMQAGLRALPLERAEVGGRPGLVMRAVRDPA
jgi:hypothetical protein